MKVWISVHGRFHAFHLARELHRHGALAGIATTYPRHIARRFLPHEAIIESAPWLEAVRRVADGVQVLPRSDLFVARNFGRFAADRIDSRADLLVGWSSATLEALRRAHKRDIPVVIERGSTHIQHQAEVLAAEYRRLGMGFAPVDDRMIERELAEYAEADAIAVPTRVAAATFLERGVPAHKLIVNPYGADVSRFSMPRPDNSSRLTRILFVGGVGVRKGVRWLLRAFARMKHHAELHLVGPLEKGFDGILAGESLERVHFRGALRSPELEHAFAQADIFCLPSLEEGFPLALLQAMAAGLPVVATHQTGAGEAITAGGEGLIVPSRDADALADALDRLVGSPEQRQTMGIAARKRVAAGFSWEAYGERALRAYEGLVAGRIPTNSLAPRTQSR